MFNSDSAWRSKCWINVAIIVSECHCPWHIYLLEAHKMAAIALDIIFVFKVERKRAKRSSGFFTPLYQEKQRLSAHLCFHLIG